MVESAFAAWDEVWADIGSTEFEDVGALAISLGPDDYADRTLASFRRLGLPHEVLDRSGVERLCPQLTLPADAWGVTAGPAGPLFANRIVTALVRWLGENGAELRPGAAVAESMPPGPRPCWRTGPGSPATTWSWRPAPGSRTSCRGLRRTADLPAGPRLCPGARPLRGDVAAHAGHRGHRRQRRLYAAGPARGRPLKFGWGGHRQRGTPDALGYGADLDGESRAILGGFRPFLRDADDYVPERMQVGFYVMDETRRFRLDALEGALVVTNCDGQMFKFGPVIGNRIVAAFEGVNTHEDLARWAAGQEMA